MLNPYNEYLYHHIVKETTAAFRREAEIDHLVDQLQPRQPNPLTRQLRRVLHDLGHTLVALGRRLDARSV